MSAAPSLLAGDRLGDSSVDPSARIGGQDILGGERVVSAEKSVPQNVMAALDRMCTPLHESRLAGETAKADANCMKLIRDYVLSTAARHLDAPLPPFRVSVEVLVECLTDESGSDYCVSIATDRAKVRSKWMRSEKQAEKLAATIRAAFCPTSFALPKSFAVRRPHER